MLRLFSQIVLCLLFCMSVWLAGLGWFVQQIPTSTPAHIPDADAIVVLTGGNGRIEKSLALLADGKGKVLFISGVGKSVTQEDILHQAPANIQQALLQRYGAKPPIVLGHAAENTIGNAAETAQWIAATEVKTIVLVTSNYHMPRSLNEFREAMPAIEIIPAPVLPDDFSLTGGMQDSNDRALLMSEYHKFIASTLRHLFVSASSAP